MRLRRGFGTIAHTVARDPSISASAKALYCVLCSYADDDGTCWPSNETLAKNLGCSERAVQKWLAELAEHRIIVREPRYLEGRQTTSITRLTDAEVTHPGTPVRPGTNPRSPRDEQPDTPEGAQVDTPGGEPPFVQNKTTRTKSPGTSPAPPFDSTGPMLEARRRAEEEERKNHDRFLRAFGGEGDPPQHSPPQP